MAESIHRYRRFKGWDYVKGASLFITIGVELGRRLSDEITTPGEGFALCWKGYGPKVLATSEGNAA